MIAKKAKLVTLLMVANMGWPVAAAVADDVLADNDVVMRAMVDELARSMTLQMKDLETPYFIQYSVDDSIAYDLSASYGAITSFNRDRSRTFMSRVRVGSAELDNTNFSSGGGFFGGGAGGSGGRAALPIDDDYMAIRQAIWWATDNDYKESVETLTRKRAHMEDKNIEDRPPDFSEAEPVKHIEPTAELHFNDDAWREKIAKLSARFKNYNQVQDSSVRLLVGAGNAFVVNSEGTRVRTADTGLLLTVNAEVQAEDGMLLSGSFTHTGETQADIPGLDELAKEVDKLVADLTGLMKAPIIESYTGPVLFDGVASGQLFRQLVADGVAGSVTPVGTQRRSATGAGSLEKKIGHRILPKSFQVYDDPTVKKSDGDILFGHYRYDDEGVKARKVDIVVNGVLKNMDMSRVPTKKLSGTNGHGRRPPGSGRVKASIGCLFVQDDDAMSDAELKTALIDAAKEEGLEYGLRISSLRAPGIASSQSDIFAFFMRMQRGQQAGLGDPVLAYRVYVDDGHEELVRGMEFDTVEVRSLKKILAAGDAPTVYNYIGIGLGGATPPSTIIAPAMLFEELELHKIEKEHDKLPILKAPALRETN